MQGNSGISQMERPFRNSDVFVVIPAYNEHKILGQTVADVANYGYSIVVVDDGSPLPELDCLAGSTSSNIWYVRHVSNLGAGAAVQTGTEFALQQGAEIIVHFDADGQHIPSLIADLTSPIRRGECEIVLGSRFLDSADRALVPARKRILLKLGVFVSWLFTGVWLSDTHNGFRAFSRTAAQRIRMAENGYAHCTELLGLIRQSKLPYIELPTTIRYTNYSMAKGQSIFNSVNIVLDLVLSKFFG